MNAIPKEESDNCTVSGPNSRIERVTTSGRTAPVSVAQVAVAVTSELCCRRTREAAGGQGWRVFKRSLEDRIITHVK
jgi:hypothetical protein